MIDKKTLWIFLKNFIYHGIKDTMMREAAYEPNNYMTWRKVKLAVEEYVKNLVKLDYLHELNVVCDDTVNTSETVKANEFHLKFCYKVVEDDGWTEVDFTIAPDTGCEFKDPTDAEI